MEIDIENSETLQAYLKDLGRIEPLEKCAVEILRGGISNKTIVLVRENGEQWVIR